MIITVKHRDKANQFGYNMKQLTLPSALKLYGIGGLMHFQNWKLPQFNEPNKRGQRIIPSGEMMKLYKINLLHNKVTQQNMYKHIHTTDITKLFLNQI